MATLDIILLIILLAGALNGLRIGLIQSLANLFGWFVALILAIKYYDVVAELWGWASDKIWQQNVLGFVSIVITVMMLTWGTIFLLDQVFKQLKLTPVNRLVGGLFGGVKSSIVILILLNALTPIFGNAQAWKQSKVINVLYPYAPMATKWSKQMTNKMTKQVEDYMNSDDVVPKIKKTTSNESSQQPKSSNQEVKNPFSS